MTGISRRELLKYLGMLGVGGVAGYGARALTSTERAVEREIVKEVDWPESIEVEGANVVKNSWRLIDDMFMQQYGTGMTMTTHGSPEVFDVARMNLPLAEQKASIAWYWDMHYTPEVRDLIEPVEPFAEMAPLEGFPDDFLLLNNCTFKQGILGIPHQVGGHLLFYRKDLLEKEGLAPPKTPEDIYEIGKKFKGTNILPLFTQLAKTQVGQYFFDLMGMFGARFVSEDAKTAVMNSDRGVECLEWTKKLFDEGILPDYILTGRIGEEIVSWEQGRTLMSISWSGRLSAFSNPKTSKVTRDQIGVSVLPVKQGEKLTVFGGLFPLIIPKNAPEAHKRAAWEFIRFSSSKLGCLSQLIFGGSVPGRKSTYDDPAALAMYPEDWLEAQKETAGKYGSWFIPPVTNQAQIRDILADEVHNAMLGLKSAKKALDDCAEAVQKLLES